MILCQRRPPKPKQLLNLELIIEFGVPIVEHGKIPPAPGPDQGSTLVQPDRFGLAIKPGKRLVPLTNLVHGRLSFRASRLGRSSAGSRSLAIRRRILRSD